MKTALNFFVLCLLLLSCLLTIFIRVITVTVDFNPPIGAINSNAVSASFLGGGGGGGGDDDDAASGYIYKYKEKYNNAIAQMTEDLNKKNPTKKYRKKDRNFNYLIRRTPHSHRYKRTFHHDTKIGINNTRVQATNQNSSQDNQHQHQHRRFTMDNVTCYFFEQTLDHFSSSESQSESTTTLTFPQRYCVYDGFTLGKTTHRQTGTEPEPPETETKTEAPIFFYTGNESPIDEYVNNTGLMFELASKPHFSALVVFAEHRYQGQSLPSSFACHGHSDDDDDDDGNDSNRGSACGCFTHLTTAQALEDFAALISHLNPGHRRPVIAFGGSYGGMLSSYMRMKYPGSVLGAIASSAPVFGLPLTMEGNITISGNNSGAGVPNEGTMDGAHRVVGNAVKMPMPSNIYQYPSDGEAEPGENGNGNDNDNGNNKQHCFDNLLAAWPLMQYYGQTKEGREVLSDRFHLCQTSPIEDEDDVSTLIDWAQSVWFDLAEGDYPYNSSYIPYALGEGNHELPAWPLQEACHGISGLSRDMNISIIGNKENVTFDIVYGDIQNENAIALRVDWDRITYIGTDAALVFLKDNSVVKMLFSAVRDAVGIWYNVTGSLDCYDAIPAINQNDETTLDRQSHSHSHSRSHSNSLKSDDGNSTTLSSSSIASICQQKIIDETVWSSLVCNDNLNLIMTYAQGVGRDFYWPPSHDRNQHIYNDTIWNRTLVEEIYEEVCADPRGIFGYPDKTQADPYSRFMDDYYGGLRIQDHSNIIFSNGLLDPWSAAGVYSRDVPRYHDKNKPSHVDEDEDKDEDVCTMTKAGYDIDVGKEGDDDRTFDFDCSILQNVTNDGGIVAIIIDLGAHHLDLMYSDERDPKSVRKGRLIEEAFIYSWIKEWRAVARVAENGECGGTGSGSDNGNNKSTSNVLPAEDIMVE